MEFLNEDKRIWDDLTDKEQGNLLLAWHKGLQIQYWNDIEKEWHDEDNIEDCAYSPFLGYGHKAFRIKSEPVKQVHWCNDYENGLVAKWHRSRDIADLCSLPTSDSPPRPARIAVIRREIVDGVINYYKEDV